MKGSLVVGGDLLVTVLLLGVFVGIALGLRYLNNHPAPR
ncbi:putative membrane protein [Rhodococcus opacus]|uniref:Putative membrane protein n=1 Tax=Rhodococcus opacus TaxID=37919 RepID=A0A1B1K839_RHOOP|nr:putative membrane protein [Rhodococcus opacus]